MLELLSLHQAVVMLLHWTKIVDDPYDAETQRAILEDQELYKRYQLFLWFIKNAIESEELPALEKPLKRPEEKRMFEAVNIPEEVRKIFPKQYNYWISLTDLKAFAERPHSASPNRYAHARDATARVAWILARTNGKTGDAEELFNFIEQLVDELSQRGVEARLGETTLRGCAREIHAAGEGLEIAKN